MNSVPHQGQALSGAGARLSVRSVAPHAPDRGRLVRVSLAAQLVRRRVGADPKADLDRPVAEQAATLLIDVRRVGAHQLQRANDAGRASELVERKEAQRVAHDDGDTGAEHARAAQPPMRDHERREAEIGLGLAAAGREEQQVGSLAVGMRAIEKAGHIEQDEGELERPPFGCRLRVRIAGGARDAASRRHGDGEIHEAERRPRHRRCGTGCRCRRRCVGLAVSISAMSRSPVSRRRAAGRRACLRSASIQAP